MQGQEVLFLTMFLEMVVITYLTNKTFKNIWVGLVVGFIITAVTFPSIKEKIYQPPIHKAAINLENMTDAELARFDFNKLEPTSAGPVCLKTELECLIETKRKFHKAFER